MGHDSLIARARIDAGLSQGELADLAGTSRPTVSAYERGRKSPTLETASRIIAAAGHEFDVSPVIEFERVPVGRGRDVWVPTALPRLPVRRAMGTVVLPLHLNWSDGGRTYDLRDRRQRARVYEVVLREGVPHDVLSYVDGALLIDLWEELAIPRSVRAAWDPVVTNATASDSRGGRSRANSEQVA
ncbi:helix-turn-helix domain-containing protein [Nocardioidaceae bacterium]|nr:helix-turn-helix domain-containing protein [Nocardioidaceae bacterium]